MTGRASSSIIFLILQVLHFKLKTGVIWGGLMNRQFRSQYLVRFNARKIYDIIDLNKGISPRERKAKIEKFLPFREIFSGYLID